MKRVCENCIDYEGSVFSGMCKINPPVILQNRMEPKWKHTEEVGVWPEVNAYDWCGQFFSKEMIPCEK